MKLKTNLRKKLKIYMNRLLRKRTKLRLLLIRKKTRLLRKISHWQLLARKSPLHIKGRNTDLL